MPVVKRTRRTSEDEEPEEEERPRSRRRDEDDEEEERPRRRAARDEEDDEEERPKRRARRDEEDEDEDDRPRKRARARDDEDEDDEDGDKLSRNTVRSGWDGFKETKSKGGDFPENLKISEDAELVKFLEEGPFANFRQHWIDSPPNGIKKKSWTCIETDCPLCDIGDRPRLLSSFNVLHLSTGGDPVNKVLELGVKATGQLLNFAEDEKTGPLPKLYYAISKSGKNQQTAYNFRPVKERDLEEDWDMEPLSKGEIREAGEKVYDKGIIQRAPRATLKDLAKGLTADDD